MAVQFGGGKGDANDWYSGGADNCGSFSASMRRRFAVAHNFLIKERKNDNHEDEKVYFISHSWRNGGYYGSYQCSGNSGYVVLGYCG